MLPAATTTRIVNKVLVKNGIRPGTPMHKKVFAPLKSFAIKHQRKLIAAAAFTAGVGARHYAPKVWARAPTRPTWARVPEFLKAGESKWNARRFIFGKKSTPFNPATEYPKGKYTSNANKAAKWAKNNPKP